MNGGSPILLVEDEPDDVLLTKRVVRAARITNPVHAVGTLKQALTYLRKAESSGELPALIILDLGLPDGSGHELMRWLRTRTRRVQDLPVIVMTVSSSLSDEHDSNKVGALVHLRKPVETELLTQAIVGLGLRMGPDGAGTARVVSGD